MIASIPLDSAALADFCMPEDDRVYVEHILDLARTVQRLINGKSRADYDGDGVLRLALTHLLQTRRSGKCGFKFKGN